MKTSRTHSQLLPSELYVLVLLKGTISSCLEHTKLILVATDMANDKRVAVFLTVLGSRHYSLLRGTFAPKKPSECSYSELSEALRCHYKPKKLVIVERFALYVERFAFYSRSQDESESATEFEAELRKLALYCGFDNFLSPALRDHFVCGLKDQANQRWL